MSGAVTGPTLEFRDRHGQRQTAQRGTVPDVDLRRRPALSTGWTSASRSRFENGPTRFQRLTTSSPTLYETVGGIRVDLHGMTQANARTMLDRTLNDAFMKKRRELEVVVGHGDVLRPAVENLLDNHPCVETVRADGGRFFVRLASS